MRALMDHLAALYASRNVDAATARRIVR